MGDETKNTCVEKLDIKSNDNKLNYDSNSLDIGVWGVNVALGGALYGWNVALVSGFGMYSLAQGFIYSCNYSCKY